MKKLISVFIFFFCLKLFSSSPNYSVTPGVYLEDTVSFNTLGIYDIYQVNVSTTGIQLKWNIVSVNVPSGWDYSICQLGTCFPGIPNGGTMDSVGSGDMGFLGLNINPFFIPGTAVVKAFVYENGYFAQGDTLTWVIHALTTSIENLASSNSIQLFPNPAFDKISIHTPYHQSEWCVIDISGKTRATGISSASDFQVDLSALPQGRFFLVVSSLGYPARKISFLKIIQ